MRTAAASLTHTPDMKRSRGQTQRERTKTGGKLCSGEERARIRKRERRTGCSNLRKESAKSGRNLCSSKTAGVVGPSKERETKNNKAFVKGGAKN